MVLNESYSFEHDARADFHRAFRHPPEKKFLNAGTRFFKLTDKPLEDAKGRITPWWTFRLDMTLSYGGSPVSVPSLEELQMRASRVKVDFKSYVRARNSICHDWNTLANLVEIQLAESAFGWFGQAASMPLYQKDPGCLPEELQNIPDLKKKTGFIGGDFQIFIPNLSKSALRTSELARGSTK